MINKEKIISDPPSVHLNPGLPNFPVAEVDFVRYHPDRAILGAKSPVLREDLVLVMSTVYSFREITKYRKI